MRTGAERSLEGFSVPLPDFNETVTFAVRSAATGEEDVFACAHVSSSCQPIGLGFSRSLISHLL